MDNKGKRPRRRPSKRRIENLMQKDLMDGNAHVRNQQKKKIRILPPGNNTGHGVRR